MATVQMANNSGGGWTTANTVSVLVAIVGFGGICVTLWLNGRRAERQRLRELYAGGWSAAQGYKEFAFAVRRRDHNDPGAERVRISEALSGVQREIAFYAALINIAPHPEVARTYEVLVRQTKEIAGGIIRDSWNAPPITEDKNMHSPEIAEQLSLLRQPEDAYLAAIKNAVE